MITNKNVEKRLWMFVVMFITYLFLGSFLVSKNLYDLVFLLLLYTFLICTKLYDKKIN